MRLRNMNSLIRRKKPRAQSEFIDTCPSTPKGSSKSTKRSSVPPDSLKFRTSKVSLDRSPPNGSVTTSPEGWGPAPPIENGSDKGVEVGELGVKDEESRKMEGGSHDEDKDSVESHDRSVDNQDIDGRLPRKNEHFTYKVLDETYAIDIERLFGLLFTDCPFQKELAARRKIFDVTYNDWSQEVDELGCKTRTLIYTVPINISFCPKRSESVEKQVLYPATRPGKWYMVDTDTETKGIPYGESFSVATRYILTRTKKKHSTRLVISSVVNYKKNMMTLIKNLIYKTVINGIINNFGILAELLLAESRKSPHHVSLHSGHHRTRSGGGQHDTSVIMSLVNSQEGMNWQHTMYASQALNGAAATAVTEANEMTPSDRLSGNKDGRPFSNFILFSCLLFSILVAINLVLMFVLYNVDYAYYQPSTQSQRHQDLCTSEGSHKQAGHKLDEKKSQDDAWMSDFREKLRLQSELHLEHIVKIHEALLSTRESMKQIQSTLVNINAMLKKGERHGECEGGERIVSDTMEESRTVTYSKRTDL